MSKIHFIGGEKGGIGKSVLARLLAQYHIDRGLPFTAFDTDRTHGALQRFYSDFSQAVDLTDFTSADRIMEAALLEDRDVLVDLAAQTALPLHHWIEQNDLLALAEDQGVQVKFWHVLDDGADGIALLDALFDRYGDEADYVVVKNLGRGKDFSAYDASAAHAHADAIGAITMTLRELNASTMRKIDHASTSLWAATQSTTAGLGLMDRQRVKVWIERAYAEFDRDAEALFTAATSETGASAE